MTATLTAPAPMEVLTLARTALARLQHVLWASKPSEELLDVYTEMERLRSQLASLSMQLGVEIEAGDHAKLAAGWQSPSDFLTETSGGYRGTGRRMLRTGRDLASDRLATRDALSEGRVSPEQAEVVVNAIRKLPPDEQLRQAAEKLLLDHAASLNASDLKIAGEHLWEVIDPEGHARAEEAKVNKHARSAHLDRFLKIVEDGLGGVKISGKGTVEDAAVIRAALESLSAPAAREQEDSDAECGTEGRDPRDHGARAWDALVDVCQKALDTEVLPTDHGRKPRVSAIVDYDKLRAGVGAGTLETGERISAAALRKIACDADIIPVVMASTGEVLDVGRSQRLVNPAIWRALIARDRHCRFAGCRRPPIACDAHHIEHWLDGGVTSLDNLVLLCRLHHTMVHQTAWEVRLNPTDRRPEFKPPPGCGLSGRLRAQVAPAGAHSRSDEWIRERLPRG